MLKRYWFYIVLLSTLVLQAHAQTTYPIQVNANLLPPYSAYLSDYYSGTREKLTLTLINRDQFKPTLNVRLRMIITAPGGLRLQTNEQAFIEPIIVENGSPVRLTQDDLAPYFQPQNLVTQGYMASGKFPEGMVEFCFQAVEAYTGQALSLSTCTRAWITSQKPPLLSLPRNNESIVFREPLNVLFQWTPLHQGLAQVEYEFILKELWDNGMTPQAAFPYAPEIYRETTRSTSLVYGAMQPPLLAGKRYAWCIRAQARDGMDAVNLFQNDGYSEIRWFTLQDNCLPPEFVLATAEKKRLNVEWTALPDHIGFSVSYRVIKARSSDGKVDASEWKEQQSQQPSVILYGLQSGGTYEYRVASYCMAGQPVYSPIFSITLPETDSARLAQCGIMPDVNLTNKEPIKELKTGEIIMANDYPVTVTKISGANGIYTGEGWTIVPWLNDAKIAVQFTSITVNTDKQMINGYIDAKYDKNEGQIANLDDVFEGGFDVGTVKTGITKVDHILDFSIPGVEAFSLNDEGDLVITDAEGEPHTIAPADKEGQGNEGNKVVVFPMTVQDKDGNVYQVEKVVEKDATGKEVEKAKATYVGKVGTPLAEGSFDPSQLNGDKAIVTFAKGDGIYGFDTWLDYYDNVSLIEGKYQKLYTDYYAPWKLVPAGKTDKVQATIVITDKNIKPEQVIFKTPKGTEYKATYENGIYKLQLAAGPAGDVQELYALYPNGKDKYYTLGKLNIVSYELQRQKVVLVPVNNVPVSKDAIQKALQDIYGPVGVTWDVVLDDNFDYTENYRLMEKSTGLSTYNEDMRALNNAYKSARADKFDKAANYLFFLKATGSEQVNDRDATGFMPRGSQFGYIFTSEIKDANEAVTVAHELGHGRWKLFHTFDEHYGGYKKGETENVMDYNNGLHVAKWQWDIMNDPAMLVSVFEGDAASGNLVTNSIPKDLLNGSTYNFITPSGQKITLPERCVANFNFGVSDADQIKYPIGYLHAFIIANDKGEPVEYTASVRDGIFLGYYDSQNHPYIDNITAADKNDNAILFVPELEGVRYVKFKAKVLPYTAGEEVTDYTEFPIKPYLLKDNVVKKSDLIKYEKISSLLKNSNEDWTLHKDFLKEALTNHNTNAEHSLIVKIVELRTAYREMFTRFTDSECYESWNEDLTKELCSAGECITLKCSGRWEKILSTDQTLLSYWKSDPIKYYERFIVEFIKFLDEGAVDKAQFLVNLSLETTQEAASDFLSRCSNDEISEIAWDKRQILFQVLARKGIYDETERNVVRIVKYLPSYDRDNLLNALVTLKDASDKGLLMKRFIGQTTDDLNGQEFYEFINVVHTYANAKYQYEKSVFAQGRNRMEKRFFSFDPSFWNNKPIVIEVQDDSKVRFAFRHQFTTITYEPVAVDPYASVTLYFEDNKTTGEFSLDKDHTYTTSGIMAYALCYSVTSDNLKIGGFVVLNTALMVTGIGELNAAIQAGRTGAIVLAGTDIALSVGTILVETKYKDVLNKTENGKSILKFWEFANTIWATGRISQALYDAASKAQTAARTLKSTATDVDAAILNETEAQAENIVKAGVNGEIRFVAQGDVASGLLAKHPDLRFIYGGFQKNLGSNITNFEKALKSCSDDVMERLNNQPDLFYKLGNIENASEAAIKGRLDDIALKGKDYGVFKTAAGNVAGKSNATLLSKIKQNKALSDIRSNFESFSDALKSKFLDDFKDVADDVVKSINDKKLIDAWNKTNQLVESGHDAFKTLRKEPDFLQKFDDVAKDADLNKHIFYGEPQYDEGLLRKVSGVHSNKNLKSTSQTTGFNRGDVRIQPNSKVDLGNGYYEAKVQIYGDKGVSAGNYVDDWLKGKKSTFFPDSWSTEKIQAEIANGIRNKIPDPAFPVSGGNTAYHATMSDGVKLQMIYSGDKLVSAFPNLR